jgi:hypothetical protein
LAASKREAIRKREAEATKIEAEKAAKRAKLAEELGLDLSKLQEES